MARTRWGTSLRSLHRFQRNVEAVSPVIGTVLILFIVVLAMAGILLWGVPAIQGLQEHAEFQSVMTQTLQLNGQILNMRDIGSTQTGIISMNHGTFKVVDGTRWAITYAKNETYKDIVVAGYDVNANPTVLTFTSVPADTTVTVQDAAGTTFPTLGTPQSCGGAACTITYSLGVFSLNGKVLRVQYVNAGLLKAESWIFDPGRIQYTMSDSSPLNRIHVEMGAVFAQQGNAVFLEANPGVKAPLFTVTPPDTTVLVRILVLDGDTAATGKGRHSVVVNLVNNFGYSKGRPLDNNVSTVRFQVDDSDHSTSPKAGLLEEGYCTWLDAQDDFTAATPCDTTDDVNVLYDPPNDAAHNQGKFTFGLAQSEVKVTVQGS